MCKLVNISIIFIRLIDYYLIFLRLNRIAGIVSWGIRCNNEYPGAYTNIPYFRNWIDQVMKDNGYDDTFYAS